MGLGPRVDIRLATPRDARAIAALQVAAFRAARDGFVPADALAAVTVEARESEWRAALARAEHHVVLAEAPPRRARSSDAREVLGFAAGGPSRWAGLPFDAEVYDLHLATSAERDGVGGGLLRALAGRLAADGHRGLVAWALARDAATTSVLERLGAAAVGRRDEMFGGVFLEERAYGWRDLRTLVGPTPR